MTLINSLDAYRLELSAQERAAATISKYIHDVRAFLVGCEARHAESLTKAQVLRWRDTQSQASAPRHGQRSRRGGKRVPALHRKRRLLRPAPAGAAHPVPRETTGTHPGGILPPAPRGGTSFRADRLHAGNPLCHGHPRQRIAVYHCASRPARLHDGAKQGQVPHDPVTPKIADTAETLL